MSQELVLGIYVFIMAIFVGFEVISRVPSVLHTPLMSGTNAIHGIVVLGAFLVAVALLSCWLPARAAMRRRGGSPCAASISRTRTPCRPSCSTRCSRAD